MRETVIAETKGHIVHFFLTGRRGERERERGGSVRQFGKRWRRGREGGQRKIGGEEEKTTMWASNCTRTHKTTHTYTTRPKVCGHLNITPMCVCCRH